MLNLEKIEFSKKDLLQSGFFAVDTIKDIQDLKVFMKSHVFSVLDFMSLLKFIQNEITCNQLPWKPSKYSGDLVRFINEIVLEEESDISNYPGEYSSHFEIYLNAMDEIGIDTTDIRKLVDELDYENINEFLESDIIPNSSKEFIKSNFNNIKNGDILKVASSFTFGRENIISEMFIRILKNLEISNIQASTLYFYLKRHIDLDGGSHGPLSLKLLEKLSDGDESKIKIIEDEAINSINNRKRFWEDIRKEIIESRL